MRGYLEAFDDAVANHGVPACRAGNTFFNIDDKGNVGLCINDLDRPVGNLLTAPTDLVVQRLAERARANPCGGCWTSCRGLGDVISGPAGLAKSATDFYRAIRAR